eukprot:3979456-Lingulodinium_polyedra.AAC.1
MEQKVVCSHPGLLQWLRRYLAARAAAPKSASSRCPILASSVGRAFWRAPCRRRGMPSPRARSG